jgi:hypothetical protein
MISPLSPQPRFHQYHPRGTFAKVATAAERCFLLPTYPRYPESEVEKNIRAMRELFGRATDT